MEFLRHLIAKKFDDFFLRMGYYKFPHIPRVLGFDTDGYYYEYVYGIEGYFPLYFDEDLKDFLPVKLIDEDEAKNEFHKVGIYIFQDIVEPTSNYVKNLIVEEPEISLMPEKISNLWKRIDFGVKSIKFDYEKIKKYLKERKKELIKILNYKRYLLLNYAVLFLILNGNENLFGKKKLEKLKKLIEPFLKSTLDHMGLIEEIPKEKKGFLRERRFKKTKIKKMKFENYKKGKEIYNKFLFDDKDFEFNLNIVSEIPSFDGIIKTKHVVPVAKVLIKNESSLKIFLIHFLIKKFEDFFITMEYYSFPHIPRPFGSYENALFYEFPFGKRLISESKFKSFQVDDLEIFYKCFLDIGIDLIKKVNFVESKDLNERVLKEFFVLQH
ncbi:MAG: hypothetical protein H5U37_07910, partial [Caldisericia bacterium]|nr:hypothetical protein [Caldisericia bacterium]